MGHFRRNPQGRSSFRLPRRCSLLKDRCGYARRSSPRGSRISLAANFKLFGIHDTSAALRAATARGNPGLVRRTPSRIGVSALRILVAISGNFWIGYKTTYAAVTLDAIFVPGGRAQPDCPASLCRFYGLACFYFWSMAFAGNSLQRLCRVYPHRIANDRNSLSQPPGAAASAANRILEDGSGVAVRDFNRDGRPDLFFAVSKGIANCMKTVAIGGLPMSPQRLA